MFCKQFNYSCAWATDTPAGREVGERATAGMVGGNVTSWQPFSFPDLRPGGLCDSWSRSAVPAVWPDSCVPWPGRRSNQFTFVLIVLNHLWSCHWTPVPHDIDSHVRQPIVVMSAVLCLPWPASWVGRGMWLAVVLPCGVRRVCGLFLEMMTSVVAVISGPLTLSLSW